MPTLNNQVLCSSQITTADANLIKSTASIQPPVINTDQNCITTARLVRLKSRLNEKIL